MTCSFVMAGLVPAMTNFAIVPLVCNRFLPIISVQRDLVHIGTLSCVIVKLQSANKHIRGSGCQRNIISTQSGRCPMQEPFAYSPAHKIAQNFILTRRQILIVALASAILLAMISLEFLNMKHGESDSAARSSFSSSSELSTGMPLP
jgi:hypothetical protein